MLWVHYAATSDDAAEVLMLQRFAADVSPGR
jgi:hypothetical protein